MVLPVEENKGLVGVELADEGLDFEGALHVGYDKVRSYVVVEAAEALSAQDVGAEPTNRSIDEWLARPL